MWQSYYTIPKAVFYLLEGDYRICDFFHVFELREDATIQTHLVLGFHGTKMGGSKVKDAYEDRQHARPL